MQQVCASIMTKAGLGPCPSGLGPMKIPQAQ